MPSQKQKITSYGGRDFEGDENRRKETEKQKEAVNEQKRAGKQEEKANKQTALGKQREELEEQIKKLQEKMAEEEARPQKEKMERKQREVVEERVSYSQPSLSQRIQALGSVFEKDEFVNSEFFSPRAKANTSMAFIALRGALEAQFGESMTGKKQEFGKLSQVVSATETFIEGTITRLLKLEAEAIEAEGILQNTQKNMERVDLAREIKESVETYKKTISDIYGDSTSKKVIGCVHKFVNMVLDGLREFFFDKPTAEAEKKSSFRGYPVEKAMGALVNSVEKAANTKRTEPILKGKLDIPVSEPEEEKTPISGRSFGV